MPTSKSMSFRPQICQARCGLHVGDLVSLPMRPYTHRVRSAVNLSRSRMKGGELDAQVCFGYVLDRMPTIESLIPESFQVLG